MFAPVYYMYSYPKNPMGLAQRCGTLLKRIPPSNRFASASPRISATHRRSYSVGNGASGTEPQSSLAREQDHKVRPYFAQKQDNVDELHKQLSALVGGSEPWKLTADGKGLEKSFRFASANVAIVSHHDDITGGIRLRTTCRSS